MIKARLSYIILLAAVLVLSALYGVYHAALMFVILMLLPAVSVLYCLRVKRALKCNTVNIQPISGKHKEIPVELEITNNGFLPVVRAELLISVRNNFTESTIKSCIITALTGREKKNLCVALKSDYCGRIEITIGEMNIYDAFSLLRMHKKLGIGLQTVVLPEIHKTDTGTCCSSSWQACGDKFSQYKSGDDPSEIFALREYTEGDKYRSIHWKLSIKENKMMVKEYSRPVNDSVMLLVDLFVGDKAEFSEAVDALIEAAASISVHLTENGVLHRICWYDGKRKELCTTKIERESDMYESLGRILDAGVYRGEPICALILGTGYEKYSRLFWFVPSMPDKHERDFRLISDSISIFYIYNNDTAEDEETYYAELFQIDPLNVGESLHTV